MYRAPIGLKQMQITCGCETRFAWQWISRCVCVCECKTAGWTLAAAVQFDSLIHQVTHYDSHWHGKAATACTKINLPQSCCFCFSDRTASDRWVVPKGKRKVLPKAPTLGNCRRFKGSKFEEELLTVILNWYIADAARCTKSSASDVHFVSFCGIEQVPVWCLWAHRSPTSRCEVQLDDFQDDLKCNAYVMQSSPLSPWIHASTRIKMMTIHSNLVPCFTWLTA